MIMSTIQREVTRTFNYSMDAGRQIPKSTNCFQQKLGETIYDLWFNLLWSLSSVYFPIAIIKKRTFYQTSIWIHIHGYINTDTQIFVICNVGKAVQKLNNRFDFHKSNWQWTNQEGEGPTEGRTTQFWKAKETEWTRWLWEIYSYVQKLID